MCVCVCVWLALYMNYDYSKGKKRKLNDCQEAKCVKGQLEFYAGVYNALLFN